MAVSFRYAAACAFHLFAEKHENCDRWVVFVMQQLAQLMAKHENWDRWVVFVMQQLAQLMAKHENWDRWLVFLMQQLAQLIYLRQKHENRSLIH
jgi:hypothetical protein